jgi:hypothetical protein
MTASLCNGKPEFMSVSQYSLLLVKISTAVWINISTCCSSMAEFMKSNFYSHPVTFCKISGPEKSIITKFKKKVLS